MIYVYAQFTSLCIDKAHHTKGQLANGISFSGSNNYLWPATYKMVPIGFEKWMVPNGQPNVYMRPK